MSAARLQQANALLSLSQSAVNIFGPAVSGAIVATAGAGWVFAIDAVSFLGSVSFVVAMRVKDQVQLVSQRFWHDLRDGWHEVRLHRWLTAGFLGFALGNVGIGMYFVLGPLVAREDLGGAKAWGLILTAGAVGGVIGGIVAYRIRPRRPVATAFAVWSVAALPAFALVRPLPLAAIMFASGVLSCAVLVGNALWETALQQEVRPDRLARVVSIDLLLSLCLMPAGQALAGPLAERFGVRTILILAGALMSVPNLLVLGVVGEVRRLKRRDKPTTTLISAR